MKPLFLDIDGVLNAHEPHPGSLYNGIRLDCMGRLNRVLKATGASLVISSAWRYIILCGNMKPLGFEYLLISHGLVSLPGVVIGLTEPDEAAPCRGQLIRKWLSDHGGPSAFASWAVVDDDPMNMQLGDDAQHRLVRTDGAKGMTDADAERLIALFGKE
jgi:hypothetical protein